MANIFQKVGSWIGKEALAALGIVNKADAVVDADAPEVEKLLEEGAGVATLVPGVGPGVATILNAGVELVGAAKATLDGTVAIEPTVQTQIQALAPSGYSIVLIENDLKADLGGLFTLYEQEFAAAKTAVATAKSAAPTA